MAIAKRARILAILCEGSSIRSISRIADVSINTVTKLPIDAGIACAAYNDRPHLKSRRIQCDEIWSFCYAKEKNVAADSAVLEDAGHLWKWTAIDADTKLTVSWGVGDDRAGVARLLLCRVCMAACGCPQMDTAPI